MSKTAWDIVEIARNPKRNTAIDYINKVFDSFIELHGDRCFKDDKAIVCGLAKIGKQSFTVIAEQKGRTTKENIERNFGMPNPESYRKAIRFMKQAEKFKRPIITFIDTKGAYPGIGAEERGQGEAIAKSMFEMARLKVPIICVIIGEGSSGGALAIGVGNKVLMLENAVYSILSPEGYSSILWKDSNRAQEASEIMNITAQDLKRLGVVEQIIPEFGGADRKTTQKMKLTARDLYKFNVIDKIIKEADDEKETLEKVSKELRKEINKFLKEFQKLTSEEIVENRYQKFRNMGEYKLMNS